MQLKWDHAGLEAQGGNKIFPEHFGIEAVNASFWAYKNGKLLKKCRSLRAAQAACQTEQNTIDSICPPHVRITD